MKITKVLSDHPEERVCCCAVGCENRAVYEVTGWDGDTAAICRKCYREHMEEERKKRKRMHKDAVDAFAYAVKGLQQFKPYTFINKDYQTKENTTMSKSQKSQKAFFDYLDTKSQRQVYIRTYQLEQRIDELNEKMFSHKTSEEQSAREIQTLIIRHRNQAETIAELEERIKSIKETNTELLCKNQALECQIFDLKKAKKKEPIHIRIHLLASTHICITGNKPSMLYMGESEYTELKSSYELKLYNFTGKFVEETEHQPEKFDKMQIIKVKEPEFLKVS